ncbi:hypothetical protein [Veillonella magna]|uniref:hypothetical protein n=1 Tax=Veillonella magna TaxID=464322 RepID=UPI0026DBCCDE|nr:hypothetical protein [Veillonella magna]
MSKKKKQLNTDNGELFIIDDTEFATEEFKQALSNPRPRDLEEEERWANSEAVKKIFKEFGY